MAQTFSAPGKIILSGEYAVVFGYPGIAVPSSLKMTATYEAGLGDLRIAWPEADAEWMKYAVRIVQLLEERTGKNFGGTVTIENELPLGRGIGSSTALVIAMTRSLSEGADGDRHLRQIALDIENTVNPGHSGIDFHTIWGGKPILFQKGEAPVEAYLSLDFLKGAILIDTGKPDQTTTELVAWMKTREAEVEPILARIGQCTERFLEGEDPSAIIRDHHRAQVELGVVPESVQTLIAEIEQSGGAAKVIGAGGRTGGGGPARRSPPRADGGGMLLAFGRGIEGIAKTHALTMYSL
ncbi:hypothetical protein HYZ99_03340 [Candidatus Peregrinibacteria bacterium]|nr:hypothetical protein [Candidatus Peregrinibacteria bacterium]